MNETILVIDTKLVMYFQYHRHKHPFNCFQDVARVVSEVIGTKINKVVWARDVGKSKRAEFFPQYKAHRAENRKKNSAAEQKRQKDFEKLYNDSTEFVRYFGSAISIKGYEADDIASIIAKRYAGTKTNVVLFSSDEDWARFLYDKNIKLLHYQRSVLIGQDDVEKEFGVPFGYQLAVSAYSGVAKENVDGIIKAGKGRVMKALEEAEFNLIKAGTILQEWCDIHKYGMRLPDWADTVQDVYNRNVKILSPFTFNDLTSEETELFYEQWESKIRTTPDELLLNSVKDFRQAVQVTPQMKKIYNLF
jgi:5'-3' exonuclease